MENQEFIKDSFIFYRSFFNSLEKCPTEIQLPLFKAIARYALDKWTGLKQYGLMDEIRNQLKLMTRQFGFYVKQQI